MVTGMLIASPPVVNQRMGWVMQREKDRKQVKQLHLIK